MSYRLPNGVEDDGKILSNFRELRSWVRRRNLNQEPQKCALREILQTGVVFVHIPKCGGKTVLNALYGLDTHDGFGHAGAEFYRAILGPNRFSSSFKFSFVREPIERCRSAFNFVARGGFGLPNDRDLKMLTEGCSFEDFVVGGGLDRAIDNVIFRPQTSFLEDRRGELSIDRICSFAFFDRELRKIMKIAGRESAIPQKNSSDSKYSGAASADVERKISQLYFDDYARFGSIWELGLPHVDITA